MTQIPSVNARDLLDRSRPGHAEAASAVREGAMEIGFLTVHDTPISAHEVETVLDSYRAFFALPTDRKAEVDMARTKANRGWGASGSEQVSTEANPDYKQVFDVGLALPEGDPLAELSCYAPNQWPDAPAEFRATLEAYYAAATTFALDLLCAIAAAVGEDPAYFRTRFSRPMALLRGNYYPTRPAGAGAKDFGIATHTDYGCLTLLATDGTPGLEVRKRGGGWIPVSAEPGTFVINFGEMLEMWTEGRVRATPHRVVGGADERLSVPLFFNPDHDANVAPRGSDRVIRAIDHLERRYAETYVHLQAG
ncbi:isopenicillin N synthase family dioxygenase [Flavimaricola marinus]|uniref:2-oxoglutarate-dependent ethylene/succinate-forming enzyme n=1 Tax=Flavimaricola marinus TaxID=1819565 RepID=A0A238LG52_9RHOB|nr:2-oxoglutarate and iron-dependent oxygenase domain-containing protein [Flavimaricola marinus]SMY07870.1 2-oxoglutarate-dependent ethylene/succinate-forming enzyme [Flavimaricola marinus]